MLSRYIIDKQWLNDWLAFVEAPVDEDVDALTDPPGPVRGSYPFIC